MIESSDNASAGISTNDFSKLRGYLIAFVTQDAGANLFTLEQHKQVIHDRLEEEITRRGLIFSDLIRNRLIQDILAEITGYGPLQPLLDDPEITEIMVNGPRKVYVEKQGHLERTTVFIKDNLHILKIIDRIVTPLGRHIDSDRFMVDARLTDGSRVNAIVPPCAVDGASITIRKLRKEKLSILHLNGFNTLT
jgi:pilus assembly protein CpaF